MKCCICEFIEVARNGIFCKYCSELVVEIRTILSKKISPLLTKHTHALAKDIIIEKQNLLKTLKTPKES